MGYRVILRKIDCAKCKGLLVDETVEMPLPGTINFGCSARTRVIRIPGISLVKQIVSIFYAKGNASLTQISQEYFETLAVLFLYCSNLNR